MRKLPVRIWFEVRFLPLVLLILVSGCGTVQEHRARQYQRDFAEVSLPEQTLARSGVWKTGMAAVSIYVALGTPEHTEWTSDGFWRWRYFGSIPAINRADAGGKLDPGTHFIPRSDPRLPRRTDLRVVLILDFQDGFLHHISWKPLETEDLRYQRQSDFGRLPSNH